MAIAERNLQICLKPCHHSRAHWDCGFHPCRGTNPCVGMCRIAHYQNFALGLHMFLQSLPHGAKDHHILLHDVALFDPILFWEGSQPDICADIPNLQQISERWRNNGGLGNQQITCKSKQQNSIIRPFEGLRVIRGEHHLLQQRKVAIIHLHFDPAHAWSQGKSVKAGNIDISMSQII